ncbi:unnamed protein product [Symbiodinium necroappetens]|uniref:Uncharacterized protein n=1 Tax=Symbiodinium necroappetens TaxID=1628268 RepID=A0A812RM87_9DINO|nr:unnamed protein product [Symbiodinium necroappetens]
MAESRAWEIPFPPDVYAIALEESLLLDALNSLLGNTSAKRIPPALGLAPVNDIVHGACELLQDTEQALFLQYYEKLAACRRRALDTHMPEPAPVLTDILCRAEALARYYLMEGQAPIWTAARQVVAELEWTVDKHSVAPNTGGNVLLGAYSSGPFAGLCKLTKSHASVCRLLNRLVQHLGGALDRPQYWSTLAINMDLRLPPHKDRGNFPTSNLVFSLTHHSEGGVWIEDGCGQAYLSPSGVPRCGTVFKLGLQSLSFPAHRMTHATCDWHLTNRVILSAYCAGQTHHLKLDQRMLLRDLGFVLPPLPEVRCPVMVIAARRAAMEATPDTVIELIATSYEKSLGASHSVTCAGRQMILANTPQAASSTAASPHAWITAMPGAGMVGVVGATAEGSDERSAGDPPATQGPAGDLPAPSSTKVAGSGADSGYAAGMSLGADYSARSANFGSQNSIMITISDSEDDPMLPADDIEGLVEAGQHSAEAANHADNFDLLGMD